MRQETPVKIHCSQCEVIVGEVVSEPIPDKPGFFRNVCTPNPMPSYCGSCDGVLTRQVVEATD